MFESFEFMCVVCIYDGCEYSFSTVPLLTHVEGDMAFFKDGSSKRIDAIILCTGYKVGVY